MGTMISVKCDFCNSIFNQKLKQYNLNKKRNCKNYCSIECSNKSHNKSKIVFCKNCNSEFTKSLSNIKNTKNNFCSMSCSATYNNTHKTTGTRRSKLEVYLEKHIKEIYGEEFALFNNKEIIGSELDIYIPSLKLAFELNGIFHYEPIYGKEKLKSIQNNDQRKFQACIEKEISLCIVDSSKLVYFKESKAKEYFSIIQNIIQKYFE